MKLNYELGTSSPQVMDEHSNEWTPWHCHPWHGPKTMRHVRYQKQMTNWKLNEKSKSHFLHWIVVQWTYEHEYLFKVCDLKRKYSIMRKQNKIMAKLEQCGSLLNKYVIIIETNNQWKYHIKTINDKQIHDVVVVETHVVLPFGVILAYAIIPNLPIPTRWSNQNQWCLMLSLNAKL